MSGNQTDKVVIYVAPWFSDVSEQALRCAVELPDVRVVLITKEREGELSDFIRRRLAGYHKTNEVFESRELSRLAKKVTCEVGPISRVFGDAEEIQVPVAKVRDSLGIPGMRHREALNFRDKFLMKSVLSQHGIKCAQHQLVQNVAEARRASKHFGFPLVIKPRSGARCANTYLVNNVSGLEAKLELVFDKHRGEALLEEYVQGKEYSCETLSLNGKPEWQSISHYHPTPLEATRDRLDRFTVVMPKSVSSRRDVGAKRLSQRVLAALGMSTGISHVEYFLLRDGSAIVSEVAARPPGAKILDLLKWAHGVDFVERWAKLMILDSFQAIPARRFAVGVVFLRSEGAGKIAAVHGLRKVQNELGDLIVEKELPWVGQRAIMDYEGNGSIIVRHSSAIGVRRALAKIKAGVKLKVA